jgi:hypothetical protein
MNKNIHRAKNGYLVDFFIMEDYSIDHITDHDLLMATDIGLRRCGLAINRIMDQKSFMEQTRSTPINRYVRIPSWYLKNYDERVEQSNPLEAIVFDPKKEIKEGGFVLERGVHLDNSYFHNARCLSVYLIQWENKVIMKVNYNFKLRKLVPAIVDITAFTAMAFTAAQKKSGIYIRAGSFSRSEETLVYLNEGKIKHKEVGNDTIMGHVNISYLQNNFGISSDALIDYVDNAVMVHYAPEDTSEIESRKKKYFQAIGLDNSTIYKKLDKFMDKWYSETNRTPATVYNLVKQMLSKELDFKALSIPEDKEQSEIARMAFDISEMLVAVHLSKLSLTKDSNLRVNYFNVNILGERR